VTRPAVLVLLGWSVLGLELGGLTSIACRVVERALARETPAPRFPAQVTATPSTQPSRDFERRCAEQLERARRFPPSAREVLEGYDPKCPEAEEARKLLLDTLLDGEVPFRQACLELEKQLAYDEALSFCQRAFELGCWRLKPGELNAPAGQRLLLSGALSPGDWRPTDEVQLALLLARSKHGLIEPLGCDRPTLLEADLDRSIAYAAVRPTYRHRESDLRLALAMEQYHLGQLQLAAEIAGDRGTWRTVNTAVVARADQLLRQIQQVQQSSLWGTEALRGGRLDEAATHFIEALAAERNLEPDPTTPTGVSTKLQEQMRDFIADARDAARHRGQPLDCRRFTAALEASAKPGSAPWFKELNRAVVTHCSADPSAR
jgi:hypothetical protein